MPRIETDRRNQGFADFKIALICAASSAYRDRYKSFF